MGVYHYSEHSEKPKHDLSYDNPATNGANSAPTIFKSSYFATARPTRHCHHFVRLETPLEGVLNLRQGHNDKGDRFILSGITNLLDLLCPTFMRPSGAAPFYPAPDNLLDRVSKPCITCKLTSFNGFSYQLPFSGRNHFLQKCLIPVPPEGIFSSQCLIHRGKIQPIVACPSHARRIT